MYLEKAAKSDELPIGALPRNRENVHIILRFLPSSFIDYWVAVEKNYFIYVPLENTSQRKGYSIPLRTTRK